MELSDKDKEFIRGASATKTLPPQEQAASPLAEDKSAIQLQAVYRKTVEPFLNYYQTQTGVGLRGVVSGFGGLMRIADQIDDDELNNKYTNQQLEEQEQAKIDTFEKNVPIWVAPRWVGPALQSLPQMGVGMAGEVVGRTTLPVVANAVTFGRASGAAPVLAGIGGKMGMYVANAGIMTGQVYNELRQKGMTHEQAKGIAISSGSMQALVETMQLNQLGKFSRKAINKEFVSKEGKATFEALYKQFLKEVGMQVAEEELQQTIDIAHRAAAGYLNNLPALIPSWKEILEELVKTASNAMQASAVTVGAASFVRPKTEFTKDKADTITQATVSASLLKQESQAPKLNKQLQGSATVSVSQGMTAAQIETNVKRLRTMRDQSEADYGADDPATKQWAQAVKDQERELRIQKKKEKIEELQTELQDIATAPDTSAEQLKQKQDSIHRKLDEQLAGIAKIQNERRIENAKARETKATEEIVARTQERIQDLTEDLTNLRAELDRARLNNEPTKRLEGQIEKTDKERDKTGTILTALRKGNLTSQNADAVMGGRTDAPIKKLLSEKEAAAKEREQLEFVGEMLNEEGVMSSADLDALNERIPTKSARSLARFAAKKVIQGYAQAKSENKNMDRARKAWDALIRNSGLPAKDRDKLPASSSLTQDNLAKKLENLDAQIEKLKEKIELTDANDLLQEQVKRIKKSEKAQQSVFADAQEVLSSIRRMLDGEEAVTDIDKAVVADLIAPTDFSDPQAVRLLAETIQDIADNGLKAYKGAKLAKVQAIKSFISDRLIPALQGNKPMNLTEQSGSSATAVQPKNIKGGLRRKFGLHHFSWRGKWRIGLQDVDIKEREQIINALSLTNVVEAARKGKLDKVKQLFNHLSEATGLKHNQIVQKFIEGANKKVRVDSIGFDGLPRTDQFTLNQAVTVLNQWKDESLRDGLTKGNKFSEETISNLRHAVRGTDKTFLKLADGLNAHYKEQGKYVAALYKDATGHELDLHQEYSGFAFRDRASVEEDQVFDAAQAFAQEMQSVTKWKSRSTGKPKSFIARKNNDLPLLPKDAFLNAIEQIRIVEQWNAFRKAELHAAVLADPTVKRILNTKFPGLYNSLNNHLGDAREGAMIKDFAYSKYLNKVMRNAAAFLKLKPLSLVKQMTGIANLAVQMPTGALAKGIIDYHSQKEAADALITQSDWYQTRYDDFEATAGGVLTNADMTDFKLKTLDDFAMLPIRAGDKWVARVGGYAAFIHFKEQGMSDAQALAKAGDLIRTTQATNNIDELSDIARSPGWKIFAQFTQAPTRLAEFQLQALRDAANHGSRETYANALKVGLVTHFAQALFTAVDALYKYATAEDDEDKSKALENIVFDFIVGPTWAVFHDPAVAALAGTEYLYDKYMNGNEDAQYKAFDMNIIPLEAINRGLGLGKPGLFQHTEELFADFGETGEIDTHKLVKVMVDYLRSINILLPKGGGVGGEQLLKILDDSLSSKEDDK